MQQQAGHGFVNTALDGPAVVVDRHTQLAQRVQHTQPLGHLLEAAAGQAAHQHRVGQISAKARQHQAVPGGPAMASAIDVAVGQIDAAPRGAALAQRGLQLAGVPADLVGHDGQAQAGHRHASCSHNWRSSAMSGAPACQVLPESRLLTQTSAGANKAGSSL